MKYDYVAVRAALLLAIERLDDARLRAGRANLYPSLPPAEARQQIEEVERALRAADVEIAAAKDACALMARRGLRVAGGRFEAPAEIA